MDRLVQRGWIAQLMLGAAFFILACSAVSKDSHSSVETCFVPQREAGEAVFARYVDYMRDLQDANGRAWYGFYGEDGSFDICSV